MRRNGTYVCGAGVTHHDLASRTEAWKRAEQERAAGEAAAKVRAHDDYMEGMRLFRQRMNDLLGPLNPDAGVETLFNTGYRAAVRDMDRALLDAILARAVEETDGNPR